MDSAITVYLAPSCVLTLTTALEFFIVTFGSLSFELHSSGESSGVGVGLPDGEGLGEGLGDGATSKITTFSTELLATGSAIKLE